MVTIKTFRFSTYLRGLIYPSQALRFLEPTQVSEALLKIRALFPFLILPFQEMLLLRVAELFLMPMALPFPLLIQFFPAIPQIEGGLFVLMELLPSLILFFPEILAGEMG